MQSYSRLIERRDFMGKVIRKRHGADFKAKVALEAIRRRSTPFFVIWRRDRLQFKVQDAAYKGVSADEPQWLLVTLILPFRPTLR